MNLPDVSSISRVAYAFVGALIGGFVVWVGFSHSLRVSPVGVSYGDLAAIALTAVTVILAVLVLLLTAGTLYGYREFMKRSAAVAAETAKTVSEPVAIAEVQTYLNSNLTPIFEKRAQTIATQLLTPSVLRELIIAQVNEIQAGNTRDADLDIDAAADASTDVGDDLDVLDVEAAEDDAAEQEEGPQ